MQADNPLIFPEWEFTVYYNENNGFKYALVKRNAENYAKKKAKKIAGYKVIEASWNLNDTPAPVRMFPDDEAGFKAACDWLEEQRISAALTDK